MFTIKIFSLFRKPVASPPRVISKLTRRARAYASENFTSPPPSPEPDRSTAKYSICDDAFDPSDVKYSISPPEKTLPEEFWKQYVKKSLYAPKPIQYQRRSSPDEEYNPPRLKSRVSVEEKKADPRDPYSSKQADPIIKSAVEGPASKIPVTAIEKLLNRSFSQRLAELIGEKGLRDSAVYMAAGMDRRLFSKIISSKNYKPSKDTALALVFALSLTLDEAKDLLDRAGYTLSHSSRRDVILEYFIREGVTNLVDINIVLEKLGEKIIGRG